MRGAFLFLLVLMDPVCSMEAAYQEGKALGESSVTSPNASTVSLMPEEVKSAAHNPQTRPLDPDALQRQAQVEKNPEVEKLITAPAEYVIDGDKDPLIKAADQLGENPALNVQEVEGIETPDHTTEHCVESSPQVERRCYATNIPNRVGVEIEEKTFTVHLSGLRVYERGGIPYIFQTNVSPNQRKNQRWGGYAPDSPEVIATIKQNLGDRDEKTGALLTLKKDKISSCRYLGGVGGRMRYKKVGNKWREYWNGDEDVWGPSYHAFEIKTWEEKPKIELVWESSCEEMDQADCSLVGERCIEGPATRLIEGVPVSAACWKKEMIFSCQGQGVDTCTALRSKGCMQDSATCTQKDQEGQCRAWQKTFFCPKGQLALKKSSLVGEKPFCLDGDCQDASYAPNQDMAEALSKMAVFDGMTAKAGGGSLNVFAGEAASCSREVANFKDCCRRRGWGMDIGLAGCTGADKELSDKRNKNLCVFVGSYCSKKVLGICTQRRNTFCCFPNKMGRICQEQGRQQLGRGWGTAEQPDCRGLTIEEVKRIDFGKIDLSELFQELQEKMKLPQGDQMANKIKQKGNFEQEQMRSRVNGF